MTHMSHMHTHTHTHKPTHSQTYTHTHTPELGTFGIFLIFSIKNLFICFFHQVNTLFLHKSYLKKTTPSQINLIKNAKNSFLIIENIQKYQKVPRSETHTYTHTDTHPFTIINTQTHWGTKCKKQFLLKRFMTKESVGRFALRLFADMRSKQRCGLEILFQLL